MRRKKLDMSPYWEPIFISNRPGLGGLVMTAARQMLDVLSPAGSLANWRFARRKEKSFGRATLQLLRALRPGSGDIVFIPTLAEPEMLGLLYCFRKCREALLPS